MSNNDTSIEDLYGKLGSSERGLSGAEASGRLGVYGKNKLIERKTNPVVKFLKVSGARYHG